MPAHSLAYHPHAGQRFDAEGLLAPRRQPLPAQREDEVEVGQDGLAHGQGQLAKGDEQDLARRGGKLEGGKEVRERLSEVEGVEGGGVVGGEEGDECDDGLSDELVLVVPAPHHHLAHLAVLSLHELTRTAQQLTDGHQPSVHALTAPRPHAGQHLLVDQRVARLAQLPTALGDQTQAGTQRLAAGLAHHQLRVPHHRPDAVEEDADVDVEQGGGVLGQLLEHTHGAVAPLLAPVPLQPLQRSLDLELDHVRSQYAALRRQQTECVRRLPHESGVEVRHAGVLEDHAQVVGEADQLRLVVLALDGQQLTDERDGRQLVVRVGRVDQRKDGAVDVGQQVRQRVSGQLTRQTGDVGAQVETRLRAHLIVAETSTGEERGEGE